MRHAPLAVLLATALLGAGACQGTPEPTRPTASRPTRKPPAIAPDLATLQRPSAEPGPGTTSPPAASPAALRGRVTLPAQLISDHGSGLIGNHSGGLIGNHSAGLVTNNGSTLLGTQRFQLAQGQAVAQAPLASSPIALVGADGEPLRDAAGRPYLTTTDAEGRYAFPAIPTDRAVVVVCQAAGKATQAAALVPRTVQTADLDLASTVMSAYVLERFARTQPDPQASLERLPADLEARAREATRQALTAAPERLDVPTAIRVVEELRGREAGVNTLYEEVRKAMVVAGQSDLGAGELATQARFAKLVGAALAPDGTRHVMDGGGGRLWKLVNGKLVAVAGLGGGTEEIPDPPDGAVALAANLGEVVALAIDTEGRPLLLTRHRLDRVEANGTLKRLWQAPEPGPEGGRLEAFEVLPMPAGGALVVTGEGTIGVAGAQAVPSPPGAGLRAMARRPDGTTYFLTDQPSPGGGNKKGWWQGSDTATPTPLAVPEGQTEIPLADMAASNHRRWLGLCADGALAVADDEGALAFVSPGTQAVQALSAATTARWPEMLRPAPVKTDFGGAKMASYPSLAVGGDAATGRWIQGAAGVGLIGADGGITMLAGDGTLSPSGSTVSTPTALARPLAALLDAEGALLVVEESSRQVLRVVDRVATLFAGVPWNQGYAMGGVPGEPDELGFQPGGTTQNLKFGQSYAGPTAEAYLVTPRRLRLAPDGAVWLLDGTLAVRRLQGGALTTLAIRSNPIDKGWMDVWPTSATAGVALVRREDGMRLVTWPEAAGTAPLATFPAPPLPDPEDWADLDSDDEAAQGWRPNGHPADGLAPLPGGGWLVRAYGATWRWRQGSPPVALPADGLTIPWHPEESQGGRLAATASGVVAFAGKRHVYRVDPETGAYTPIAGRGTPNLAGDMPDTGLIHVKGIATAPNGDLLIVDVGARQVKRLPAAAWAGGR
ncbi:MAG: hypothetical protein VKS61_14340 [Candidatus Sericytochromatia bacterium]|nr:hypothetical protein [Candidatus Sericytochromatia bacterium]